MDFSSNYGHIFEIINNINIVNHASVPGAALILKTGLVHFMGRPDDMNYDDSTLPFQ